MKLTVVELPARWGEPERALAEVDAILGGGRATDLVLLPETALTGYVSPSLDFDLSRFAEPLDGPTARALAGLARKHRTHLFGPLVLREEDRLYNATVGFDPDGRHVVTYRKRHPWVPETWASAGREPYPLVEVAGALVTIACCYDVHFLADDAGDVLDRADLLLFPSSWVEEESTRLRRLRRLARRHSLAIAAANWGRPEAGLAVHGQGGSGILNAKGDELASVVPPEHRADAELA